MQGRYKETSRLSQHQQHANISQKPATAKALV